MERPPVRKAVIPAAGLGTRFLPVTKAQPKEMLPVVDKPAIQYVVEEAVAAGLSDILVITGRGKRALEDHFDRSPELELELRNGGKAEAVAEVAALAELAHMHFVRQGEPRGLGHAVGVARHHIGDESFAVLLGDDLMVDDALVLNGMLDAHRRTGAPIVALRQVPQAEISSYGCAAPGADDGTGLVRLAGIVEKPAPEDAPSDLAVMGRYVFGPEVFDAIDRTLPGRGGEIQLTDAIALLMADGPVYGYVFRDGRYDIGNKLDYLRATVELAAARPDLGPEFRAFLRSFVSGPTFEG
jgi:UTP--glucose-1-phosphate uridylyltransferase